MPSLTGETTLYDKTLENIDTELNTEGGCHFDILDLEIAEFMKSMFQKCCRCFIRHCFILQSIISSLSSEAKTCTPDRVLLCTIHLLYVILKKVILSRHLIISTVSFCIVLNCIKKFDFSLLSHFLLCF